MIRTLVYKSARHRGCFRRVWHPIGRLSQLAHREQELAQLDGAQADMKLAACLGDDLTTRAGPFAGLRYPTRSAIGSALTPKLLGCYEQELHPVVRALLSRQLDAVYDIGCAEGYYAVGLARLLPSVNVFAFDIEPTAREQCQAMAAHNGVADRVHVAGLFARDDLAAISADRALIWCDCEGYERDLFSLPLPATLARHDLLIEVHDFIRPFTLAHLRSVFGPTHDAQVLRSVPDMLRPTIFPQALLDALSEDEQIIVMSEIRPAAMTWLWLTPRDRPEIL
ncbi:MAG TPA: hypothetical protein VF595_17540 [Tepidisphaeraceae bacterium]